MFVPSVSNKPISNTLPRPLPGCKGLVSYAGLELITRPVVTPERLQILDKQLSGTWVSKKVKGGIAHQQRCPAVTVDTIYARVRPNQEIEILLGTFDKTESNGNHFKGLVLPGGGHVERVGQRMNTALALRSLEAPHGSLIEAASRESLEEVGIRRSQSLFPPKPFWVMDDLESEPRQHCLRVIFGACLPFETRAQTSDEIATIVWTPLSVVQKIIDHEISFKRTPDEELYFTIGHGDMLQALMQTQNWKTFLDLCLSSSSQDQGSGQGYFSSSQI